MRGDRAGEDRDIEMSVTSYCQTDKRTGARRLCCEEASLRASGKFVVELPSAALPLLVPDLATFVWWRDALQVSEKVFETLLRASDRLVIDSGEFEDTERDLAETNKLFAAGKSHRVGISDLNWARLTLWRGLLADFYDVPAYQSLLDRVDFARIDYVGPERAPETVAPQALLLAGWLASRLGWTLTDERPLQENSESISFKFTGSGNDGSPTVGEGVVDRIITLELNRVEQGEHLPGRLVEVELRSSSAENNKEPASFVVARSADNLHVLAEAKLGPDTHRGRVLPVRNRSAVQLLSREMEILCNDQICQDAVAVAAKMIDRLSKSKT
jgi:glucose-6-phosphate dehydrogenase assembly protein OpcA